MKLVVPEYYNSFKCIADRCKHSCCIGWEIDVDDETLEYYQSITGELGKRINSKIDLSNGDPHFILEKGERCPFLKNDGLCELICSLGEGSLCNICSDHPRFRNYYSDRTEMGFGLCCEEAARIILSGYYSPDLIILECDDENHILNEQEKLFFTFRDDLFLCLDNSKKPVSDIAESLLDKCGIKSFNIQLNDASQFLSDLEHLDSAWAPKLKTLLSSKLMPADVLNTEHRTQIVEIIRYFIYRHLADGIYDGRIKQRVAFAVFSAIIIAAICVESGKNTFEYFADVARMYSSEIEYSDENVGRLLDYLSNLIEE